MKFYLHGMFGGVPVVIATVDWSDDIPLMMDRHTDRAHIFDTAKGDDMAELCRIASEYGFPFYAAAVEPQVSQTEFDWKSRLIEFELSESFGPLLDKWLGPTNSYAVVSEACVRAINNLPAFRNQDIVNDFRLEVARIITMRICIAMRCAA